MSICTGLQSELGCQEVFYEVQASSASGLKFQWKQRQIIGVVYKAGLFPQHFRPREACYEIAFHTARALGQAPVSLRDEPSQNVYS